MPSTIESIDVAVAPRAPTTAVSSPAGSRSLSALDGRRARILSISSNSDGVGIGLLPQRGSDHHHQEGHQQSIARGGGQDEAGLEIPDPGVLG